MRSIRWIRFYARWVYTDTENVSNVAFPWLVKQIFFAPFIHATQLFEAFKQSNSKWILTSVPHYRIDFSIIFSLHYWKKDISSRTIPHSNIHQYSICFSCVQTFSNILCFTFENFMRADQLPTHTTFIFHCFEVAEFGISRRFVIFSIIDLTT